MWRVPESPKRLLKKAEKKAAQDAAGKHWTKEQLAHRVNVRLRRLRDQQERGER